MTTFAFRLFPNSDEAAQPRAARKTIFSAKTISNRAARALSKAVTIAPLFSALIFVTCSTPRCSEQTQHQVSAIPVEQLAPLKTEANPRSSITRLYAFEATISAIYNKYWDQKKIVPKRMVLGALRKIEEEIAEVIVEVDGHEKNVVLHVDTASKSYTIPEEPTPSFMPIMVLDVINFIADHLPANPDKDTLQRIEYAAANGVLATLDPHSVLLDKQYTSELRTQMQGFFGGVGIVVGMRKGELIVIKPIRDTPTFRAGIRKGDRILRIGNQSTTNMAISDAASRLRGPAGTKIEIWVKPKDGSEVKKLTLTREEITVRSVNHHLFSVAGKPMGYIRISNFSHTTVSELKRAFTALNADQKISGLVLDLRGNPGGLLTEATGVVDLFLNYGVIMSAHGSGIHQEFYADGDILQPIVPLAILVDGQSASASEIVAGALKNYGRAIILGRRTFGKGSLQDVVFLPDGGSLKYTIGQYLTSGIQSIQSVGIVPHIELKPMFIRKNEVALFHTIKWVREQDLNEHLTSQKTKNEVPILTLNYYYENKGSMKKESTEDEPDEEDTLSDELLEGLEDPVMISAKFNERADREIKIAGQLIASVGSIKSSEMLSGANSKIFFEKIQQEELEKVRQALVPLGINWTPIPPPTKGTPQLIAVTTTDHIGDKVRAGETLVISVLMKNQGTAPAGQVRAQLKSDSPLFEDREFILGKIEPGQSKLWQTRIKIPTSELSHLDQVKVQFYEQHGHAPKEQTMPIQIEELPRPQFSYHYELLDIGSHANGDGLLQKGESVQLHVTIKNIGQGTALKPIAGIRAITAENVLVNQGRFELEPLPPGQENQSIFFTFDVLEGFQENQLRFELQVQDGKLFEVVEDKISIPIAPFSSNGRATDGVFLLSSDAEIRSGVEQQSPVIAHGKAGSVFIVEKIFDSQGVVRILLDKNLPGFISLSSGSLQPLKGTTPKPMFIWNWQVTPPIIKAVAPPLLTNENSVPIHVLASDDEQVLDAFIVVRNPTSKIEERKVYYRSNRLATDKKQMSIDSHVPLWPGINVITLIVRQSQDVTSREVWIVYKDSPLDTSAKSSPKKP